MNRYRLVLAASVLMLTLLAGGSPVSGAESADPMISEMEGLLRASIGGIGPTEYRNLGDGWHALTAPLPVQAREGLAATHAGEAAGAEATVFFLLDNGILNGNPVLPIVGTLSAINDLPFYRVWTMVFNNGSTAGNPKPKVEAKCGSKTFTSTRSLNLPPGTLAIFFYTLPQAFNTGGFVCTEKWTVKNGIPGSLTTQFILLP